MTGTAHQCPAGAASGATISACGLLLEGNTFPRRTAGRRRRLDRQTGTPHHEKAAEGRGHEGRGAGPRWGWRTRAAVIVTAYEGWDPAWVA